MNDETVENDLQARGLSNGPRITPADLEAEIIGEYCFTAADGLFAVLGTGQYIPDAMHHVTFCVLMLRNGTKVVGTNTGAINPKNFCAKTAREMARVAATDQMWPMLGYELRSRLAASN